MSHGRKKILVFSEYYLPGFRGGGPIRSLSNMIDLLSSDFEFYLVTKDHDLGSDVAYRGISSNSWFDVGSAKVYYSAQGVNYFKNIFFLIRDLKPDVIYVNSFFSFKFSIYVVLLRFFRAIGSPPILLAPRGEFSLGALRLKSVKKLFFIRIVKLLGIYSRVRWHASTSYEAIDISRVFERNLFGFFRLDFRIDTTLPIGVAPDLVRLNAGLSRLSEENVDVSSEMLDVCFLSRISPKKNLIFALKILAKLDFKVKFTIYGPIEDSDYWSMCQEFIRTMPPNIIIVFAGPVSHEVVLSKLSQHNLFLLPTMGENFGHVFLEAWSAGLVVLVSDQTPWRDLRARLVGWDIPLDSEDDFVDVLTEVSRFDTEVWADRKIRCVNFALENMNRSADLVANRALFQSIVRDK